PGRRRVERVDVRLLEHPGVLVERARILLEILPLVELQGVDEDRDDDAFAPSPRLGDERDVSGVQSAHRRHEGDPLTARARRVGPALHGLRFQEPVHHFTPPAATAIGTWKACASVGKTPARTSRTYASAASTT